MTGAERRPRAVVLLSGGLDSATTLAMAVDEGFECHTLALDYGQRHRAELEAAASLSAALGAAGHRTVQVDLRRIGGSALTDDIPVPVSSSDSESTSDPTSDGIPVTYVPARNTVLLAIATGLAETLAADALFIGVNAVDYSGYPDCRPQFIAAFEDLARLATKRGVEGHELAVRTPLIHLSKAEIIRSGDALGVDYSGTVSCYQADATGRACGHCDSCRIRRDGFEAAGVPDPTRYVDRCID
ncbi:7-cyano-7-deazaguanine synthase QueC [Halomonas denitrificans]|nr:7-cyano-7-deazaguanine synthase QueC [Halomonas denitrificans]